MNYYVQVIQKSKHKVAATQIQTFVRKTEYLENARSFEMTNFAYHHQGHGQSNISN
jgi:hypothetical protein